MRLLFFAILSFTLHSCGEPTEEYVGRKWVTYTAPDKKFQVDIPEGYKIDDISERDDFLGYYKRNYIYWRTPSSWIPDFDIKMVEVAYIEIPGKINNNQHAFNYLSNKLSEQFDPDNGKTTEKDLTVNGYRCKKYIFNYESSVFYMWTCLVGDRVYKFEASVYNNYDDMAEIERIFTSFKPL